MNKKAILEDAFNCEVSLVKNSCLDPLHTICEKHKTVSTAILNYHVENIGDRLKDYAASVKRLIDLVGNEQALNKQASERIASLESALSDLLDLQNGCPLPSYQNEYDEVIARASELLGRGL